MYQIINILFNFQNSYSQNPWQVWHCGHLCHTFKTRSLAREYVAESKRIEKLKRESAKL